MGENKQLLLWLLYLQVIDVIDCETGLPVCGVLQPLTSVCGVISIVTSEFLWKFEKCLLGNDRMAMLDWRNTRREKSSLDFFTDLERKPLPEATLQLTSTEVFCSVIGSQNALQGKKSFWKWIFAHVQIIYSVMILNIVNGNKNASII